MAYIGKSIESGTFSVLDTSGNTYNGSNTAFNLGTQVGSVAQLLVSHDGVIQKPGTDYTLSSGGAAITFTTAPASGASIFIVEISGAVGGPLDSDLNGTELILDADGDTSITADTDDQIDFKIAGADDLKMTANAINVLSGTTLTIDSGATITNSGTANGFGALAGIDDQSSSNDDQITITDTAVVINEDSDDVDFRVESNGDANCLFVNGGDDEVGIGVSDPLGKLHIKTGAQAGTPNVDADADELVLESNGNCGLNILSPQANVGSISFSDDGDADIGVIEYVHNGNSMRFTVNATEHFRIASDGSLTATDTSIGSNSDSRVKENIANFTYDLTKFKQLQPRTFDWKNPSQHNGLSGNRGFIAQEVKAIDDYWTGEILVEKYHSDYNLLDSVIKSNCVINDGMIFASGISESDWEAGKLDDTYPKNSTWKASVEDNRISLTSKLGKKDAMYISVINQLITRIEALEG